ncbi:MAG: hypothetical protein NC388_07145 [Clostridium sp.]|nr:hypothetical protein [Clostridium sp.]
MSFISFDFLVFLPLVFLSYWFLVGRNLNVQNLFVVIVSYVFYGWWSPTFLLLIFTTSACSYASGLLIRSVRRDGRGGERAAWWIAAANVAVNVGILGVYKYYDFFAESLVDAFALLGVRLSLRSLHLVLPVGISFYTFQALSYTIDVYRRKLEACKDPVAFFAFISFFPQLVAGPIERATSLLPQFQARRHFHYTEAADGCRQMLWGFFKKMVIADNCGKLVDEIYAGHEGMTSSTLVLGMVYFTFQSYCDFSGYSDIAIGTARLFGIRLTRNFNFPNFSRDIAEFWRRWHMSLNTWWRDYIYYPLGGSRCNTAKRVRNTAAIFLVSALWHGGNWTFIAWGIYHILLFIPLLLLHRNRRFTGPVAEGRSLPTLPELGMMLRTFLLVAFGRIFFRSESIEQALSYIRHMCSPSLLDRPSHLSLILVSAIALMTAMEWYNRNGQHGLSRVPEWPMAVRTATYWGVLLFIYFFAGHTENFIYFQF